MKYKNKDNYLLVKLERGDEIMDSLKNLAEKENINFAQVNGIGLVEEVEIGLFDFKTKKYKHKKLNGEYELTSLMGNITIKENNPFIHMHVNISDDNYKCFGGHLFHAKITVTGELFVIVLNDKVERKYDEFIGLHLWDLDSCE